MRSWRQVAATVVVALVLSGGTMGVPALAAHEVAASSVVAVRVAKVKKPKVTKVASSKATVSWTRVKRAASYELRVGTKTHTTKKTKTRVKAKVGAKIRVRAVSVDGRRGKWSAPTYRPPVQVTNVKAAAKGADQAVVSWKRVKGAKKYVVRVGSATFSTKATSRTVRATAAQHVRVRAVGKRGPVGAWSKVAHRAPSAPTKVAVRASGYYQGFVSWLTPTGATEAQVRVGSYTTTVKGASASLWMEFKDAVAVRVKGPGGWSPWTEPVLKPLSADERRDLLGDLGTHRGRVASLRVDVQVLDAEIAKLNSWLMVAVDHGDTLRAQQIRAELAVANRDRTDTLTLIDEHLIKIAQIEATLIEADKIEP